MICGIHREKLKRAFSIHHINYDKELTIKENCISLCIKCHSKVEVSAVLTEFERIKITCPKCGDLEEMIVSIVKKYK